MSDSRRRIPCPTPFDQIPAPELSAEQQPLPPSCLRATTVMAAGYEELSIVYKRTYAYDHAQPPTPTDIQPQLIMDFIPYESEGPDVPSSYKETPEIIGYKTGTDLIVRGSARSDRPVTQTQLSIYIGSKRVHRAEVLGKRYCDFINGKIVFTPPQPFVDIPLRYENAYGGPDLMCQAEFIEQLNREVRIEAMRRIRPIAENFFSDANPLIYPRNRFGKGYILEGKKDLIEGRELPNIEWPNDRLTPDNIIVGNPLNWLKQPLPVGFDYLDPAAFPRSALFGLPPVTIENPGPVAEVERGYLPSDFSRGNIFTCSKENIPQLIHADAGRCASLGLWLPFLKRNESIRICGMDPQHPEFEIILPNESPLISIPGIGSGKQPIEIGSQLYLAHVDIDDRRLTLVWVARTKSPGSLSASQLFEIENSLTLKMNKD